MQLQAGAGWCLQHCGGTSACNVALAVSYGLGSLPKSVLAAILTGPQCDDSLAAETTTFSVSSQVTPNAFFLLPVAVQRVQHLCC